MYKYNETLQNDVLKRSVDGKSTNSTKGFDISTYQNTQNAIFLDMSELKLNRIPAGKAIGFFKNVIWISLADTGIKDGLEELEHATGLEFLEAQRNQISKFPDISKIKNLKEVDLTDNEIKTINVSKLTPNDRVKTIKMVMKGKKQPEIINGPLTKVFKHLRR